MYAQAHELFFFWVICGTNYGQPGKSIKTRNVSLKSYKIFCRYRNESRLQYRQIEEIKEQINKVVPRRGVKIQEYVIRISELVQDKIDKNI